MVSLSPKQLGLLARLYDADQRPADRRELSLLLWPRSEAANARHSLSQALYIINRRAPGLVEADPEQVWAMEALCDTTEFRKAITHSDWARASSLYSGPFLRGFGIGDSPAFAHWRDHVREELTDLAEQAVEGLFEALRWPELLRLSRILVEQGRRNEVVIRAHIAALAQERGTREAQRFIAETPELDSVAAELFSTASASTPLPRTRNHPFVGRAELIAELGRLYDQSVAGEPAVVLLKGEPGIGKTALTDRFCRYLALKGARVLSAVGQVSEQNVPHGVVEQWLDDLSTEDLAQIGTQPWMSVVRHVFPSVARGAEENPIEVGEVGDRRLLESLRRLFTNLAQHRPLVLSIDDLHLADPASVGLARYLFKPGLGEPALLLATVRSDALTDVPHLGQWHAVHEFTVGGLSVREIREWVERVPVPLESASGLAETLYDRTGGNPLLISALLDEGAASDTSGVPPSSIVDFYRPRISSCSKQAKRLLAAISIVGDLRSWEDLAEIADLTPSECAEASSELEGLNWIVSENEALGLRHSLLGQAAISLISNLERKAFHGRAARVLVSGGESPSAIVAVTHDLAGNREAAFTAAVQAAEACDTLHANAEREYFLKIALGNAPTTAVEADIRIQLAELYLSQRQLPRAVDILDMDALGDLQGSILQRASMTRLQALAEMTGDTEVLRSLWHKARDTAGNLPAQTVAQSFTRISGVAYDLGLDDISAEAAELVCTRLSQLAPTIEQAQKLLTPVALLGFVKGAEQAVRTLESMPEPDEQSPTYSVHYYLSKASLLVALGHLVDSERLFAIALGITERFALYDNSHALYNNLGVCFIEQGRFDEARTALQSALKYAADTSPSERSTAQNNSAVLAFESGEFETGLQAATSLLAAKEIHGWRAILDLWAITGLCSLELGDLAQAREAEREINAIAPRSGKLGNDMSYVYVFLARMMEIRGEVAEAVESLTTGIEHYRPRNRLAAARMELEKYRLQLKTGHDPTDEIDALLADLQGSGAVPLIERAEGLKTRARLKRG